MDDPSLTSRANALPTAMGSVEPFPAIGKLPIPLTVRLCRRKIKFSDFLKLGPGDVISFDTHCDSLLELAAGEMTLATGAAMRQGGQLGFRLDRLDPRSQH